MQHMATLVILNAYFEKTNVLGFFLILHACSPIYGTPKMILGTVKKWHNRGTLSTNQNGQKVWQLTTVASILDV